MPGTPLDELRGEFERALLASDRVTAGRLVEELFDADDPFGAVEGLVVPVLENIGAGWERGDRALAQVYMSGRICEELVDRVLTRDRHLRIDSPRVAIAVLDDFHMLGKRLVYSVLRAAGYDVRDFGRMEPAPLLERLHSEPVDVLLLSVLMLPSALRVPEVVRGLPAGVRLGVGGAPFRLDPELGREVGAHAVGGTAADAVSIVRRFTMAAA